MALNLNAEMTIKDLLGYFTTSKKNLDPNIGKLQIVDRSITVAQIDRTRKDIRLWRNAMESAESPHFPTRVELIDIYEEIIIDPYISEAMKKRVRRVRNTPAMVFNAKGEKDEAKTNLLHSFWFQSFLEHTVNAEFWGFSLMELKLFNGQIMECCLVPRQMVRPEFGIISTYSPYDTDGIKYKEKPYHNYLIFAGGEKDLGLLNKLAPYSIYKRATLIDWAEHSELYGMPIRTYTYDPNMPSAKKEAEQSAREAGSAAYVVIPKGTELILNGGDGTAKPDMYETFRQSLNSEMIIAILGQTMTTEAGSSRSQGEVHERTESDIFADDLFRCQVFANGQLAPRLVAFDILAEGDTIVFDKSEKLSIEAQLAMDIALCEKIDVPMSYLYAKYNIPTPEKGEAVAHKTKQGQALPTQAPQTGKAKLEEDLNDIFFLNSNDTFVFDKVFTKYAEIYLNALKNGLESGITLDLLESFKLNAVEFAYAKTLIVEKAYAQSDAIGKAKLFELASYTKTEKELFTASRQMAYKWEQAQAQKETLPLLKYDSLNDSRVRPAHLALDGITRPIDDEFWKTHYPPMGYNCRCSVQQIESGDITDDEALKNAMQKEGGQPDKGFEYNVGIEKLAFKKDMSYFSDLSEAELKKAIETAKDYFKK